MPDVSIVIPVGSYHADIAQHAVWSANAQTVPCEVIIVHDTEGRGPAWARNQGLAQVTTPFVVFLDADDTIERSFIARCLSVWQPKRYVYTDFFEGNEQRKAPACPWVDKTWHVITTLIPTAYARQVGGFDESLPGAEDTDFYLRLTTNGFCGLHLPLPLFRYGSEGRRAKAFMQGPDFERVMGLLTRQYGGKQMSCCGNPGEIDVAPVGDRQTGDVLAVALWAGNRQERGRATGRLYPRTGNRKLVWVDPRDAAARPDLWEAVADEDAPDGLDVFEAIFGGGNAPAAPVKPAPRAAAQPDFARVIGAGKQAFGG